MTVEQLRGTNTIIYEVVSGSKAYGLDTPESDTDIRGIYAAPLDALLMCTAQDQVADDKNDVVFYELGRVFELLEKQNPNIIELLNMPEDCIIYKHPVMDEILKNKEKFITKECRSTFGGYAVSQIKKARGLNKKINLPENMERKGVLDFCYVFDGGRCVPIKEWLGYYEREQKYCGLSSLNHARFCYALYYDKNSMLIDKGYDVPRLGSRYKGVVQDEVTSNDISVSEIPKFSICEGYVHFNKDAYQVHCKEYRSWEIWKENRNPHRYAVTVANGNDYDSKNLSHCIRLIRMAKEILVDGVVNVRRADREELLRIKNGVLDYEALLEEAELGLLQIDELYTRSSLPECVDKAFSRGLKLKMRKVLHNKTTPGEPTIIQTTVDAGGQLRPIQQQMQECLERALPHYKSLR